MNPMTLAIIFAAIGVTSDNLLVAGWSGYGFSVLRNHKWILIILLLFIIQNEMLILGNSIATLTQERTKEQQQWVAIGILVSMGLRMLQELYSKGKEKQSAIFETKGILLLGLDTAIYVFAFGCASHWLRVNDQEAKGLILLFIGIFLAGGLFLGKGHHEKLLRRVHTLAVLLVLTGAIILVFENLKWS